MRVKHIIKPIKGTKINIAKQNSSIEPIRVTQINNIAKQNSSTKPIKITERKQNLYHLEVSLWF